MGGQLTGNITDGVTLTTETSDQDLVVLLDVVEATVVGDESGDLLAVLAQLDADALADGRVRLLGFHATANQKTKRETTFHLLQRPNVGKAKNGE